MTDETRQDYWPAVWHDVARQLRVHRLAGRGHLLTEDTVRLAAVIALESVGIAPKDIRVEVFDPALRGGKLDLVVQGPEGRTVIELKFPRGSQSGISPDTMTLGELLRDFLRVALVPAEDRWVAIVLGPELRRYLVRRGPELRVDTPGGELLLERVSLESLPKTARDAIGPLAWLLPVRATCVVAAPVDVDLTLFAYRVQAPTRGAVPGALATAQTQPALAQGPQLSRQQVRPGSARAEILEVIQSLMLRSGRSEVAVREVVDEMRRSGSRYTESTVRTMMTSHMCAQVHGPNIGTYDDLDRIDRGKYRLRGPTP
jgi:hypothetical protein